MVAAAYGRLGEAVLGRLRGDFVCVIWDHDARRGLIARDQLGGRSLYFRREGRGLAVRLRGARPAAGCSRALPPPDRTALLQWLSLIHHVGPETLYEGVEALLPGQLARFGPGGVELAALLAAALPRAAPAHAGGGHRAELGAPSSARWTAP